MPSAGDVETDQLIQVLRHRHAISELREGSLERRELEDRLGVSRATSHRYVRTLEELGFIEKADGRFQLTNLGVQIADAVGTFEAAVSPRLRLAPMVEALQDVDPPVEIGAFVTATVTSAERGDPYSPLTRFLSLVQGSETLRGINTSRLAPTYMDEFKDRILGGMRTELIDLPEINRDIMERYPEKCVQVCVSGNLDLWVHDVRDALPVGLVILDECIGVGLFDAASGTMEEFIDTDDPDARAWAMAVYDHYRAESVYLENFTVTGLQAAENRF